MYYKIENNVKKFFTGNVLYTDEATIINPTEQQMLDAGWLIYTSPEISDEENIEQIKQDKIIEIETYDQSDQVESFTIGGKQMWLGHELRQQIKTSVEAYALSGIENVTKWFGGQAYTFTTQQWLQMLAALEIYAAEALNTTEMHKSNISQLTTEEEIENYDYTTGYPDKLVF